MPRVEIHMKISRKMKSTQGIPIYLKILKATRRSSMVSTNPETRGNISLTARRHAIGGALPPGAFLAQSQDNPEEWFLLGLTCALVVRKRRGLSRQIWRAYQDRSLNALVYHPQRTASSKLKSLHQHQASRRNTKNWRLHQATWRKRWPQANKSYPRSLDSWRPQLQANNLLTPVESFWAY
jgi:hypothetical protein